MRRWIAAALLAVCASCGSDLLGPTMSCAGNWIGTENGYNLGLQMVQTDTTVTGIVRITGNFGFAEGTIAGVCPYPAVNLTINVQGFDPITYVGTLSPTSATIAGKLNGSGFQNLEIDVQKQ